MDTLSDVGSCLRALQSTKVTERKKAASKLEDLLTAQTVVETLDKNSENERGIGWNVVFNAVKSYVDLEIDTLQNAKESQSSATLANRGKKKQEALSLYKTVLRKSNSRKPHLQLNDLLESILEWLKDNFRLKAFGSSLTNLLLKNVLRIRKYWLDISSEQWKKLLLLHCHLYLTNEFDRSLLAQAVHELVVGNTRQGLVMQPQKLMLFFGKALDILKRDSQSMAKILSALNAFHWAVASTCRLQLCEFGEKNMNALLSVWARTATEKTKEDLVDILYLQMTVHHPSGVCTQQDGALAYDWPLWEAQLQSLCDSLITDVDSAMQRTYFQGGSRNLTSLSSSYVNLASHVFKQVPNRIVALEEVEEQASGQLEADVRENGTPAKRPRLSNDSKTLVDFIDENSNKTQAIPWLKMLAAFLTKFPAGLGSERLLQILQRLSVVLKECTKSVLFEPILKVLAALATAFHHLGTEPSQLQETWQAVWTTCLNTVISRQAQSEGYQAHGFRLMATLLDAHLATPGRDVWNVFLLNFCKPTQASCALLASIVSCKGLDERYCPSMLGRTSERSANDQFPLRQLLLEWLTSETCFDESQTPDLNSSPQVVSLLCLSLIHQDPASVLQTSEARSILSVSSEDCVTNAPASSREVKSREHSFLSLPPSLQGPNLELLFLSSTFNADKLSAKKSSIDRLMESARSRRQKPCNPVVVIVVKTLTAALEKAAASLSELTDANIQSIQYLTWIASFVAKLLSNESFDEDGASNLRAVLRSYLEKLGFLFVSYVRSNGCAGLQPVVKNLIAMVDMDVESTSSSVIRQHASMVGLLMSCLSADFVDVVMDLASRKKCTPIRESGGPRQNRYGSRFSSLASSGSNSARTLAADDFSEDATHSRRSECHSDMETDDFDTEERSSFNTASSSESSSSVTQSYDASDFLSPVSLKENEQVQVLCVRWLCLVLSYGAAWPEGSQGSSRQRLGRSGLRQELMQLSSSDRYQPNRPVDVLVLMVISSHLLRPDQEMDMADVKELLIAIRHTAKEHFRDQEICCRLLFHLRNFIPVLAHTDGCVEEPDGVVACRNIMVKFVRHFGVIYEASTDRVKLEYIHVLLDLLKYDPEGRWGSLAPDTGEDSDDGQNTGTVSHLFLSHIQDEDAAVRMLVASQLKWLVMRQSPNGVCRPLAKREQLTVVRTVFQALEEVLDRQVSQRAGRSQSHGQDEMVNRRAVCLQGIATLLVNSPVCEKEALYWLCTAIADGKIPTESAIKMLKTVCVKCRFQDVKSYLECHLPFLILRWFEQDKGHLQRFPSQLMGYESVKDFVRCHQEVIISSILISTSTMDSVRTLMELVQVDAHSALLSCLPHILAFVLPVYVSGRKANDLASSSTSGRCFSKASKCYDLLKSELTQKEISDCVYGRLCEITVLVISCVQMEADNTELLVPEPNPPFHPQSAVVDTLDYIANTLSGQGQGQGQSRGQGSDESQSLVSLLAKVPCGLHTVLTALYTALCKEHRSHELLRLAQTYRLFVTMVMKEFHTGLEDGWAAILREIVCRLVTLLSGSLPNDKSDDLNKSAESDATRDLQEEITLTFLDVLGLVALTCVEICPDELANYLHQVIDVTASLAASQASPPRISRLAVKLLGDILGKAREQWSHLESTLGLLNPLPEAACLREVSTDLRSFAGQDDAKFLSQRFQDLSSVLELLSCSPSQGLALRLDFLSTHISRHHNSLDNLLTTANGAKCLRGAISQLLGLCASQRDGGSASSTAAAKCLGAIGPVALGGLSLPTMPLATAKHLAMAAYREHELEKYCWMLHHLDDCLLDQSWEVVSVAGAILRSVLAMQPLADFKESYQHKMKDKSFLFNYLQPFHQDQEKKLMAPPPPLSSVQKGTIEKVDQSKLWCPREAAKSHAEWVTSLVHSLLSSGAIKDKALCELLPMCRLKVEINEEALPYLIHTILLGDEAGQWRDCLSRHFSDFFQAHCDSVGSQATDPVPVYLKKQSLRVMLSVVQHLRKQNKKPARGRHASTSPWDNNFWLDLDYLPLARAAHYCQAEFSALLFIEIWWNVTRQSEASGPSATLSDSSSLGSSLDHSCESTSVEDRCDAKDVQGLLLDIYSGVGDPDALYGCGAGRKSDAHSRVLTYLKELEHSKALTTLDIEATGCSPSIPLNLMKAIQACGADNLLQKCFDNCDQNLSDCMSTRSAELEEFCYETAWKLGQWDFGLPSSYNESSSLPFHKGVYNTLYSLRENHLDVASYAIGAARKACVSSFDIHAETCQELYPFLSRLQCLVLLQEVVDGLQNNDLVWRDIINSLIDGTSDESHCFTNTANFECVLSQLEMVASLTNVLGTVDAENSTSLRLKSLWGLAVCARQAKRFQLAEKTMHALKVEVRAANQEGLPVISVERVQLEEAELFWARSEVKIALDVLKGLIRNMNMSANGHLPPLLPKALATMGSWLAATRSETPTVIMNDYLEKSVELLGEPTQNAKPSDMTCYLALAQYADAKYQQISDYMKSPIYKDKMALLQGVKDLLNVANDIKDSSKYLKTMERNASIDEEEIQSLKRDYPLTLKTAICNYLRVLRYGSHHDLKVFRVVALWFENAEDSDVNTMMQEGSTAIATHKFLPLYYQLAARMNAEDDGSDFQAVVQQVMESAARDHPHHTLWIVLALAQANKDDELLSKAASGRRGSRASAGQEQVAEEGRVQAAKQMLNRLKATDGGDGRSLREVITNMEILSSSYIELANWNLSHLKNERKPIPIDANLHITRLRDLRGVLLPTVDLKVELTGDYSHVVYPAKFGSTVRLVGGVNLPKVFSCTGSDGRERTQLVKGRDDLRQDAVMQQVFSLVNQVLAAEPEARQRQLNIRTYKVVPLSQKSGVLEWCTGTQPIGEYLIGSRSVEGAHTRYQPRDWKAMACRGLLAQAEKKLKTYKEICAHFKPVFRHFFMEKFKDAPQWFEKRLAYTRSVATNSIVGYIMGLGDRHVQNILIDLNTAELIHIDLGIAFEMGRILPTPETVPFRLTRDIVDGMGITGVEGIFRRCCEKTMQVLRDNTESLLTIVQVLVHDPLSHWSLSPHQVLAIQKKRERMGMDSFEASIASSGTLQSSGQIRLSGIPVKVDAHLKSDDKNKMAERTLLRLKAKLSGMEDGTQLGVDGQVNSLIQQASDPKNLSRLFAGWQPYL